MRVINIAARRLAARAEAGIDAAVKATLKAARRHEQMLRAHTDVAFRAWHDERYGADYRWHHAQHLAARVEFDTQMPTETPVDRWMERIRHVYA